MRVCLCVLKRCLGGLSGEKRKPDWTIQREGERKERRKRGKKVKSGGGTGQDEKI